MCHDIGGDTNNAPHVNFWIANKQGNMITNDINHFMDSNRIGLHYGFKLIQTDDLGNGPIVLESIENSIINTPACIYWRRLRDDEILVNVNMMQILPQKTGRFPPEFIHLVSGTTEKKR